MTMYSLVNIAVVARDLCRLPAGRLLARDLLHVLTIDEAALSELDTHPVPAGLGRRRARLAADISAEPRALQLLAETRAAAATAGLSAWSDALDSLESAPMGGRTELLRWVRTELLAPAWDQLGELAVVRWPHALEVITDGLLADYVGTPGDPLAFAWRRWTRGRLPATVTEPAVAHVVAMIRAASPEMLAAAGSTVQAQRNAGWSWAQAMHDACWAIELTGRTRTAAVAQLEAVDAVLAAAGGPPPPAAALATTAAVHASVVADVLGEDVVAALCRPLLAHLG